MSSSSGCEVYNAPQWIEENRDDFKPPVCNKCMFSDQLKVFFIGGPNARKDYHLELGEEVFYQTEGDMVLKVVEEGKHRDISIKQGEIFLLPGNIEHSPQRKAGTVGVVIERERDQDELDCLRYFVDGTTDILFERWFHLDDVVKDLPKVIKEFNESDEAKTGKPGPNSKLHGPSYEPINRKLADPIDLNKFINDNIALIEKSPFQLYGQPEYRTSVHLYGKGKHHLEAGDKGDIVIMPQRGEASLNCDGKDFDLGPFVMARIRANHVANLEIKDNAVVVIVKMPR